LPSGSVGNERRRTALARYAGSKRGQLF